MEPDDSNISRQEVLEKELLKIAVTGEQKRKPFQREIMGDILDKLRSYEEVAREKEGE